MISPITNNIHNVCFKELQDYVTPPECVSSQENKIIAKSITKELMKQYPGDKKGRSFLERANHYNQDVYLTEDQNGGVRVSLFDRMWKKHPINTIYNGTYVGTYTQPEQFSIDDILKKYNINERNEKFRIKNNIENNIIKAIFVTILIAIFGILIHNAAKQEAAATKTITELVTTK